MDINCTEILDTAKNLENIDNAGNEFSPQNLAYIGDVVFELLVRSCVMDNSPVNELYKKSSALSCATAQSAMYHKIKDMLSADEYSVLKRGRNAKTASRAKNASMSDYRHATGLEALFGYLYIKGDISRISELFNTCISDAEKQDSL